MFKGDLMILVTHTDAGMGCHPRWLVVLSLKAPANALHLPITAAVKPCLPTDRTKAGKQAAPSSSWTPYMISSCDAAVNCLESLLFTEVLQWEADKSHVL